MRKRRLVFQKILERLFATGKLDSEARALGSGAWELDLRTRELGFQTRERLVEVRGIHPRALALHDEAQELDVEVLELGLGLRPPYDLGPEPHVQLGSDSVTARLSSRFSAKTMSE